MDSPIITIFTPTYNRGHLLMDLYESLKKQTIKDFEWIIVDDGSKDNTSEVVNSFIEERKITIHYFKKENEGKHIAINKGVELAQGELFFIVDSDDILPAQSLEVIIEKYNKVNNDTSVAGVAGRRGNRQGGIIGTEKYYEDTLSTSLDLRLKEKIDGDMAEVYRTEILKKYPFPKFEGEKFCPEALIWQQIDQKYKILWFSDIVYECEYLRGGLSDTIVENRKKSPKASCLYYSSLSKYKIPFLQKIKAVANYWRFAIYSDISFLEKIKKVSLVLSLLSLPLIVLLIFKDNIR